MNTETVEYLNALAEKHGGLIGPSALSPKGNKEVLSMEVGDTRFFPCHPDEFDQKRRTVNNKVRRLRYQKVVRRRNGKNEVTRVPRPDHVNKEFATMRVQNYEGTGKSGILLVRLPDRETAIAAE